MPVTTTPDPPAAAAAADPPSAPPPAPASVPALLTPAVLREEALARRFLGHAAFGMLIAIIGGLVAVLAGDTADPVRSAIFAVIVLIGLFEFFYGAHSYLRLGRFEPLANVYTVLLRELRAYFSSPIAVTVFVIFHLVAIVITLQGFGAGGEGMGLWERGFADMEIFFQALPWLLLFVVPALSMRLWAEERQTGSIELLMTLPMSRTQILLGKFLGAWLIVAWMLFLPAVSLLALLLRVGSPDVGQITASFIGAVLMGGAYLALGSFLSSLTRDQIVAFILTVVIAGAISLMGSDDALDAISAIGDDTQTVVAEEQAVVAGADSIGVLLAQTAQRLSLASRFRSIGRGVLDVSDLLYYVLFIGFFLYLNAIVLAFRER